MDPHDAKLRGDTDIAIVAGELLMVRMTIRFAPGLQVKLSVALPEPASLVKEIDSGSVAHVIFGVVGVAVFKITIEYAIIREVASIAPTMIKGMYFETRDGKGKKWKGWYEI